MKKGTKPPHPGHAEQLMVGEIAKCLWRHSSHSKPRDPAWLFNAAISTTCSLAGDGSTLWEHDGGPFCLANGPTHIFVCFETILPGCQGPWLHFGLGQKSGCRIEQTDPVSPHCWMFLSCEPMFAPLLSGVWGSSGLS